MKFLLTNDDGISAAGLRALETVARRFGEVVVVAPDHEHSGVGHRVTTDRDLRLTEHAGGRYSLDGTPADCTRVALVHIAGDVDWVLSGTNHGGNLGSDVFMSGTVAAVREGALLGKPGLAISHYRNSEIGDFNWERTLAWTERVLASIFERERVPGAYWNVNFPHLPVDAAEPELIDCPLDRGHHAVAYRQQGDSFRYSGAYAKRNRTPGSDVDTCFSGAIAITRLSVSGD